MSGLGRAVAKPRNTRRAAFYPTYELQIDQLETA